MGDQLGPGIHSILAASPGSKSLVQGCLGYFCPKTAFIFTLLQPEEIEWDIKLTIKQPYIHLNMGP